jgi:rhodanese-related sulfurtransferase
MQDAFGIAPTGNTDKVTADEVGERLQADPEHVTIVDTRAPAAWESSDIKAAGAIRIPPDDAEKHIADISRDDYVVTYCT